jgi:mono/diheme cytochrome c family protein
MAEAAEEGMMRTTTFIASLLALGGLAANAVAAAEAPSGERVYQRWCVHCHAAGRGNPGTQSLQTKYRGAVPVVPAVLIERTDLTPEVVTLAVRQGAMSMPPFRKTEITDAELAVLSKWIASGGGKR